MKPGPGIARTALPLGFSASGINSGVRKYRPDLGVLISDRDAVTAGVFTLNECKAAPILYSRALVPATNIRAIVTNSGQANAATGPGGLARNQTMAASAAARLGVETAQVLTASTGVIGTPLDIDKITAAMPDLIARATDNAEAFAVAILTTDLIPKTVSTQVVLSRGTVRITGICKGSGMIHPNMGTMLGYLLTDAALTPVLADRLLRTVVDDSFNMISVDGDTSTNDAVFLMANGVADVRVELPADVAVFSAALMDVAKILAQAIARDGEGATKVIECRVTGAADSQLARKAARGVTVSPLVKCAVHGEDPNWGRILARLGADGISSAALDSMRLVIQDVPVFDRGSPVLFDQLGLRARLKRDRVVVAVELCGGDAAATAWGCDLTKKYVEINTEYPT